MLYEIYVQENAYEFHDRKIKTEVSQPAVKKGLECTCELERHIIGSFSYPSIRSSSSCFITIIQF